MMHPPSVSVIMYLMLVVLVADNCVAGSAILVPQSAFEMQASFEFSDTLHVPQQRYSKPPTQTPMLSCSDGIRSSDDTFLTHTILTTRQSSLRKSRRKNSDHRSSAITRSSGQQLPFAVTTQESLLVTTQKPFSATPQPLTQLTTMLTLPPSQPKAMLTPQPPLAKRSDGDKAKIYIIINFILFYQQQPLKQLLLTQLAFESSSMSFYSKLAILRCTFVFLNVNDNYVDVCIRPSAKAAPLIHFKISSDSFCRNFLKKFGSNITDCYRFFDEFNNFFLMLMNIINNNDDFHVVHFNTKTGKFCSQTLVPNTSIEELYSDFVNNEGEEEEEEEEAAPAPPKTLIATPKTITPKPPPTPTPRAKTAKTPVLLKSNEKCESDLESMRIFAIKVLTSDIVYVNDFNSNGKIRSESGHSIVFISCIVMSVFTVLFHRRQRFLKHRRSECSEIP